MIARLMLSLKKANASQEHAWNLGEPVVYTITRSTERRGSGVTRDGIHLNTFAGTQGGTQSQE